MSTGDHRIATDATLQLILAAIQALEPGLVTTAQAGKLAPDAEAIENGFIKVPDKPGLGIEIDELTEEQVAYMNSWKF